MSAGLADMIKFLTAGIGVASVLGIAVDVLGTGAEVIANSSQFTVKGGRLDGQSSEALCGSWPFYHTTPVSMI
jgi:hypothetical protein